jgi:SAM-dependent methyltransferase
MSHERFYSRVLRVALANGALQREDRILVVAGGALDSQSFAAAGCMSVTISNLDSKASAGIVSGHGWSYADAEALPFRDGDFDVVAVHAGLHHCRSPHAALAEMYRVARRLVIVMEARDSAVMRTAVACGFAPAYEVDGVIADGYSGGWRNGELPNFIYRWTEREVVNVVRALDPGVEPDVSFHYGLRLPTDRMRPERLWKRLVFAVMQWTAQVLFRLVPSQGNEFAILVRKGPHQRLQPWIQREDTSGQLRLDRAWGRSPANT